jgi:AcrR family transcriptional regulator
VYGVNIVPRKVAAVNIPDRESAPEPEKRPYHHGRLREALVAAGIEALEREPFDDLRVRELARRVGVSPNAAYRHFADREALLAAIAAEGFRRFGASVEDAIAHNIDAARSELRVQGTAYVRFARENPALFRLMFGPIPHAASDELARASTATYDALRDAVAATLGTPDRSDPAVTVGAVYAWSIVHGLSYLALDRRLDDAGDVDRLIDAVLAIAERTRLTT